MTRLTGSITYSARPIVTDRSWVYASTTDTSAFIDGETVDWTAVDRAVNGLPQQLAWQEQYQAARILGLRGELGHREIGRRTGVNERTIFRWSTYGWPERRPRFGSVKPTTTEYAEVPR
jgi:hypothetical protein